MSFQMAEIWQLPLETFVDVRPHGKNVNPTEPSFKMLSQPLTHRPHSYIHSLPRVPITFHLCYTCVSLVLYRLKLNLAFFKGISSVSPVQEQGK